MSKRICLVVSFLDPFIKKSRFLSRPSRDLGDDFLLVTNASLALQTLIPSDGAPLWWKLDHLCFQFKQIDFCLKIMKINCSCYLTYYHGCLDWILCLKPPKFWYRSLILKPGTTLLNITAEKLEIWTWHENGNILQADFFMHQDFVQDLQNISNKHVVGGWLVGKLEEGQMGFKKDNE